MSTIKVNSIKNTSTDDGGIAIDNTGHVQVDGQQLPTAGALSHRNLVVNGSMIVAQRSTSVTGVANSANEGYQTLDRFGLYFANNAGGVCTVSQSTDAPTNQGFRNSYKIDVTTADTSVVSNQQIYTSTILEAREIRNSGWNYTDPSSYLTLSFWVKSSKAGTYCITMRDYDAGAWYYVFEYTLVADTWTKVTHSIPGHASLVFNDDTSHGLDIRWVLVTGTDRDSHTGDSWLQNGTAAATPNQVNFFDSTSNDFYLTGVQLELGEKATPFEHRSYGDELHRCMRYCQRYGNGNRIALGIWDNVASNDRVQAHHYLPVWMRVTPALTQVTNGHALVEGVAWYDVTGVTLQGESNEKIVIYTVVSNTTGAVSSSGQTPGAWGNGAKVTLDAEL